MQLFGGGTDTSACFMNWAILYMCVYPEIQQKVQDEIDLYIKGKPALYKTVFCLYYTG